MKNPDDKRKGIKEGSSSYTVKKKKHKPRALKQDQKLVNESRRALDSLIDLTQDDSDNDEEVDQGFSSSSSTTSNPQVDGDNGETDDQSLSSTSTSSDPEDPSLVNVVVMLEKKLKEAEAKVDVLLHTNGKLELRVEQLEEEKKSLKEKARRLNTRKDSFSTTFTVDETSRAVDARGSHDPCGKANAMGLIGLKRKINIVGDEDRNEVYTTMAKDILLSHNSNFLFASSVNKGNKLFRQIAENYVGVQATIDLNNQPSVWTAASEIISTMETIHPGCRFLKQKKENKSVYTTLTRAEEIGVAVKLLNELDRSADERSAKQNADIQFPQDLDVISSHHNLGFEHKGNLKLHELASSHKHEYETAKLGWKHLVGTGIVMKMKENGTRFLKQVPDGFWYELSDKQSTNMVCDMMTRKLGSKKARGCTISSSSNTAATSSTSNTNGDTINAVSPCMETRSVHSIHTKHGVLPIVPQLPLSNVNHEYLPRTEIIYRQRSVPYSMIVGNRTVINGLKIEYDGNTV